MRRTGAGCTLHSALCTLHTCEHAVAQSDGVLGLPAVEATMASAASAIRRASASLNRLVPWAKAQPRRLERLRIRCRDTPAPACLGCSGAQAKDASCVKYHGIAILQH